MSNLIVCPKCNKVISYNSHFSAYICNNCGYIERCSEEDTNNKETTYFDDTIGRQEKIKYKHHGDAKRIYAMNVGDTFVYLSELDENLLVFRLIKKCEEIVKNGDSEEVQKTYTIINLLTGEIKEFAQQNLPPFAFPVKILNDDKEGN